MAGTDNYYFTPPRTSRQEDLIKGADCGKALCDVCEPNFDPDKGSTLKPNSACQGVIGAAQPLQTLSTQEMMSSDPWTWAGKANDLKYYSTFYNAVKDKDPSQSSYYQDPKCGADPSTSKCNVWTRGNTNFNKMLSDTDSCSAYKDGNHMWVDTGSVTTPWSPKMGMPACTLETENEKGDTSGPEWCHKSNRGTGAPITTNNSGCGLLDGSGCSNYDPVSNTVKLGYYSKTGGCIPGTVGMNWNTQKKYKLIVVGSPDDFSDEFRPKYKNPVGGYNNPKGQIAETAPCPKQGGIGQPLAISNSTVKGQTKTSITLEKFNPAVIKGLSVTGAGIPSSTTVTNVEGTSITLSNQPTTKVGSVDFFAPDQVDTKMGKMGPSRAQAAYTFEDFNVSIDPPRFPIVALHKVWGSGTDPNGCAERGCDVKDNPLNNRGVNGKCVYISKEKQSIRFPDPSTRGRYCSSSQRVLMMEAHGDLYAGDIGGLKKGGKDVDGRANSCIIRSEPSEGVPGGRPRFATSYTDCGDAAGTECQMGESVNTDVGCRVDLPKCPNWVELTKEADGDGWNKRVGGCGATRDSYGPGVYNLLCYLPGTKNENDTLGKEISRKLNRPAMRGYVFAIWPFHYEEIYARDATKNKGQTPGQYRLQRDFPCFNSCDGPEYCEAKRQPYNFTYMTKDNHPVAGTFPCPQAGTVSNSECNPKDATCVKGSQDAGSLINMQEWWGKNLQVPKPSNSEESSNIQSCAMALEAATTGTSCRVKEKLDREYDSFSVINHEIDIEIPTNAPGLDWDRDMTWDTMNANLWLNDINNYDADTGAYYSLAANRADNPDKPGVAFMSESPDDDIPSNTKDYHWFTIDWYVDDDNSENNYVAFYFDDPFDPYADEEDQPVTINSDEYGVIKFPKEPSGRKLSNTNGSYGLVHTSQRFVPTRGGRLNFGPWMAWWGYGGNKGHTPAFNTAKIRLAHMSIIPYLKHPPGGTSRTAAQDCTRESCIPSGYSFPQSFDQPDPTNPDGGVLCDFVNLYMKRVCDSSGQCSQKGIIPFDKPCIKKNGPGDVACFAPTQACDASKLSQGLNCYPYTPPPETWNIKPKKKSNKWLYIGLGIGGGILLIAGAILLIYFLVIKPRSEKKTNKSDSLTKNDKPDSLTKTNKPDSLKKTDKLDSIKKGDNPSTVTKTNKSDAKISSTKP